MARDWATWPDDGATLDMEPRTVPAGLIWTAKDLAAHLRIGQRQAYDLLATPGFPARKIGDSWRAYAPAVIAWLSKKGG